MADKQRDWPTIFYYGRGVFAVLLSLAILLGGGWFVFDKVHDVYTQFTTPEDDYVGEGTEEIEVLIPSGAGITQIGDILYDAGVIKSVRKFRNEAQQSGQSQKLQAGRFKLKKELPVEAALDMLLDPANQQRLWVTFPEGTTVAEQAAIIAKEFPDIDANLSDEQLAQLELPEFADGKAEGFLFPARYVVAEPVEPGRIRQDQVKEFNRVAAKLDFLSRAEATDYSPLEILTVASIIEGEVYQADYQPMVAQVIYNRLDEGMKLEMDSTVHFFTGKDGGVTTTKEQRATDNPYNTYKYKGLPPGPINNPGEAAMSAALSPADTDALFFVTVDLDTGETLFAKTLEEHEENVKVFQKWCRDNPGRCSAS